MLKLPPSGASFLDDPGSSSSPLRPEIAFLARHGVSEQVLRIAAAEARNAGVFCDEALIKNGHLHEEAYYAALATELGVPFLDGHLRVSPDTAFPESALAGLARLAPDQGSAPFVLAPTGERAVWVLTQPQTVHRGIAITTPTRLNRAIVQSRASEIARRASHELDEKRPGQSFGAGLTARQRIFTALVAAALGFLGTNAPAATLIAGSIISGLIFLGMVLFRLAAVRQSIQVRAASIDGGLITLFPSTRSSSRFGVRSASSPA